MKRTKRYNELDETNGPASGKKETTIRGLKGIPLTTENPMITEPEQSDIDDEDTSFSDEDITIDMEEPKPEMEEPKPIIDKNNKPKKMKRLKNFKELTENIGPALDGEFATNKEDIKKQGEELQVQEEPKEKKSLLDLVVGDIVWCEGGMGGSHLEKEEIKKITQKYDEDTGKPYNVIWLDDRRNFDSRHGGAMNGPSSYHIAVV